MVFFISDKDGAETGPYEQEVLKAMAERGELSPTALVRNTLMKEGKPAKKVAFLKEYYKDLAKTSEEEDKVSQIARHMNRTADAIKHPPVNFRFLAFIIDAAIVGLPIWGLGILMNPSFPEDMLLAEVQQSANAAAAKWLAYSFIICLSYFSLMLGTFAQTLGMKFFGIMIVTKKGDEVLFGRCFVYSLSLLLTLPIVPFMVKVLLRGPQEYIANTRIVNVRLG